LKEPENDRVKGEESEYVLDKERIGSGSYAEVFRATDTADDKVYACKVVDQLKRAFSQTEKENTAYEIALLKALKHDNIVLFKDVSQQKFKTYIFTEFVDGITLHEYYRNCHYFSELDARHIFQQVCEAIQYLHGNNIVHRDIKSENIMLIIGDNDYKVKLIDFGLARHTNTSRVLSTYCGTPFYMAPETSLGEGENGYSKPVDIWALGVMLFRMLVGSYPFGEVQDATSTAKVEAIPSENAAAIPENPTNQTEAGKPETEPEEQRTERRYSVYDRDWQKMLNRNVPRSQEDVSKSIQFSNTIGYE
ncbi:Checkpoint kinase 2, partial [Mortierella sp. AD010]